MSVDSLASRLQRPLVWVIGSLLTLGLLSALAVRPAAPQQNATRAGIGPSAPAPDGSAAPQETAAPGSGPAPPGAPDAPQEPPPGPAPLRASAVPAPGVHRYEVRTTDADGTSTVQEELREVEVLSGDRTVGTVRISARLDGESQVSVLDWSPAGALVRSTRIETPSGTSQECTWDPPFPELGALAAGVSWRLDSTCRTPVGGVDTVFTIAGHGTVSGPSEVDLGGERVRVWRIERDRTTTIEAEFAGRSLRQTAREQGTLLFDPGRGLVLRSDVTVTLEGAQNGVTRRVSVLQIG